MKGHFYKPHCKCVDSKGESKKTKKCTCGAKWSYILDIGLDPKTGKRRQKKKGGFKTKSEAQEAAAVLIVELSRGSVVQETKLTFEEFSSEWLDLYEATGKIKISTIKIRKFEVNVLLNYFAKIKLKDLTRKMYQNALNDFRNKKYADNTIVGIHRTARMIFKKALEMELIIKDPTEYAQIPKTQKTVEEMENENEIPKYMEKEELSLFLKIAKEKSPYKDYPIFMLLAYTGMRIGELCALKWKDIDFNEGTISITKTIYNPGNKGGDYVLLPPKTKGSKRILDVDAVILNVLEKHRAYQNKIKMKFRKNYHDADFVFAKTDNKNPGYPETVINTNHRMKRLLKNIGVISTDLSPHSFRHTHTSLLAEAGVSLPAIMERLGHTNDETTTQIYLHITKTRKKEAAHKFSRLMESL